jgi:SAM-dependent methyltransferase
VSCRSCGAGELTTVLDLGRVPLANALLSDPAAEEPRYPLSVALCPRCTLLQLTESVPPEQLFSEYLYFSSFSDTMLKHAAAIAQRMIERSALGASSLAAEIASNDGYLLQHYQKRGVPVLGIEPAKNVAKVAVEERGIPTVVEFFGRELAPRLVAEHGRADVLHANNVLAHVPDLNGFVAGIAAFLRPDTGVAVIEVPYAKALIDHLEFDTIYHEHLSYFSLTALDALMRRHGLAITDVERIPIHGGSLRLFVRHAASASAPAPAVSALLAEEASWGVGSIAFYRGFADRVRTLGAELGALLERLELREGKRIAAYGAAAKGSTLLNFFGIGRERIDFIADRSTYKQGRFMSGVRIPIRPPEALLEAQPDYCLLLTWNFAEEILEQQAEYRRRGGRFIIPIPEVRIV